MCPHEDYVAAEESLQDGQPQYFYIFTQGASTWQYTNEVEDDVSGPFGSIVYEAVPISHTEIQASQEVSRSTLSVTLPADNAVAQLFFGWMPEETVSMTVYRGHRSINQLYKLAQWKGRVTSARWQGDRVVLDLENVFTSLQRNGCRARVQAMCRHALYETGCEVSRSSYETAASITAVSGLVLTVSAASGEADGWWVGGHIVLPDGSMRSISAHSGSSITITRPSRYLTDNAPPHAISMYPGCDHSPQTCHDKFDNLTKYGGFPSLPGLNPFTGISLV